MSEDAMHPEEKAHLENELGVTLTYNPRNDGWNLSEILTREQLDKLVDITPDHELLPIYKDDGRIHFIIELPDDDGIDYVIEMAYEPIQNILEFV